MLKARCKSYFNNWKSVSSKILDNMEENQSFGNIKELLKNNDLPYEDIIASKVQFITEKENGVLVGCIGVEKYNEEGLLRSFAVRDEYKNKGIGKRLLNQLIDQSKTDGLKRLHLLTTTADGYFDKNGFKTADRAVAPNEISSTKEFSEICPSSSVYMIRDI
ncbi:hypothetical protein CJ263_11200 [Maribacter cobaltidurans]|uniref:N-acetyltransferase domain-containing protein n=2 Tax=Maribacter cobaltidurans TaxID=1178778 RepID=A0A223V6B3_9FLAO|nr:hypothetical protein CJ263_11200 [Maribacter cobaltidurans]